MGEPPSVPSARWRRACAVVLAACAWLWAPGAARAGDAQEFQLGKARWDAGEYEEAARRFSTMLNPDAEPCPDDASVSELGCRLTNPVFVESAQALYAATLVALDREADARVVIEQLLRNNLQYRPNPAEFPSEVIDLFVEIRGPLEDELQDQANAKALAELEARRAADVRKREFLAYVDALENQAKVRENIDENSRLVAMVPFGVGQFQNGDDGLGWFFAISQATFGLGAIGTGVYVMEKSAEGLSEGATSEQANDELDVVVALNRVSFTLWGLSTIVGIVEAQLGFEEARRERRDVELPPRPETPPELRPSVTTTQGGAVLGVTGTF